MTNSSAYPQVSIALATYNGGEYLQKQMQTLQAQTYPNIEIVVSDDNSTDGTYEWLCEQALKDSRIRVLPRTERLGFNGNFMRCFAHCHGAFISPCDQDDIWELDKTQKLIAACPPGGIAYCDSLLVDADNIPLAGGKERFSQSKHMADNPPMLGLMLGNSISGHAMLFDASFMQQLPEIPGAAFFDWWMVLAARAQKREIIYVDEPLVRYRQHAQAVTSLHKKVKDRTLSLRRTYELAAALADSPHTQELELVKGYLQAIENWVSRYISVRAFQFFWKYRTSLFWFDQRRSPTQRTFKYLLGYRLKSSLQPNKYPAAKITSEGKLQFIDKAASKLKE